MRLIGPCAGMEGIVLLRIFVGKDGTVREIRLAKGVNSELNKAAVEMLEDSRWTPAIQNNNPVGVWVSYPVRFRLR